MRLNMHTARFYDVTGTSGIRRAGRAAVYSTANPFLFSARVVLQTGEGKYRIVDGTMTNCRLPKPDWQLLAKHIDVADGHASSTNTIFKLLGVPIFDLPYLRHPVDEGGRESGLLIPIISNGSSIRGFTFGEQVYIVINRSMDMVLGTEYYSQRGWAPNGDFRYKGPGLDHLTVRWNALFDRGYNQEIEDGPQAGQTVHVNQGGVDILALGRKDFSPDTRIAGNIEYLSNYVYRLVFNDNYWQAVSSEVKSEAFFSQNRRGFIPSVCVARLQTFASSTPGDEARILHLPSLRFDVLDQPLGTAPAVLGHGILHRPPGPLRAQFPRPQHRPVRCLSAPVDAHRGGRMELRARGRPARDLLLRKRDARPDRRQGRRAYRDSTIRCDGCMAKLRSISARRPWCAISNSPAGTGPCAM